MHTINFTACNALCGAASTQIQVFPVDHPPVVTAPATASGLAGVLLHFDAYASDPDGDAIVSFGMLNPPPRAQFVPDPGNHHAVFDWIPNASEAGYWIVTFVASNALSGSATTNISVNLGSEPPVVTAPATASTSEGVALTFGISAVASDGGHVSLTALGLPLGATFMDNGNNTGTFAWLPGYTQAGDYAVQFRGVDDVGLISTATTAIHVNNTNRAPVANAGGPYQGIVGLPVAFNGGGSADPDGDPLAYLWSFGDGGNATGVTPSHTYASAGLYPVTLQVTDPSSLSSTGNTTANILSLCTATLFQAGGNRTLRLNSGKPSWCTEIEPVGGCFTIGDVVASSIVLKYPAGMGAGIAAASGKNSLGSDLNQNGIEEFTACFSKAALRPLFAGLPSGENFVTVSVEGALTTGGRFAATGTIRIFATGGALAASVTPNPLHSAGELQFLTSAPGALRVRLFDIQGRLVRTLLDEPAARAGSHSVPFDGRDGSGSALPAGIYFYRIETPEASTDGRLVIAR
jgi:PKD repeat protein